MKKIIALLGLVSLLSSCSTLSEQERRTRDSMQVEINKQVAAKIEESQMNLKRHSDSLQNIEDNKRLLKWTKENPKAAKIHKKHPEWSLDDCELLAKNRIWIGMDIQMLKYKRGLPNSANPSNYGGITQWQWCWHDYTPSCYYDNDGDGKIDAYN